MIFTRHSAGKIWSSICIQDIIKLELHYQINLVRLILLVSENNVYMLRTHRRIKNPVKHLRWSFL